MDDPLEKDHASFHEKLKTSSPQERPSLYDQEIKRLEFKLREETLGYEHAKVHGEFLDEAAIENYLGGIATPNGKLPDLRTNFPLSPSALSSGVDAAPPSLLTGGNALDPKRLTFGQATEYLLRKKQTLYQCCLGQKVREPAEL